MLGYLNRFSVDLDFDFTGKPNEIPETEKNLEKIFKKLGLKIKDKSRKVPQYFLKYPTEKNGRNTIKIDITFPPPKSNAYEPKEFAGIDRIINCQTVETMFANKLVALIDRWEKNKSIAGRDLYDIHHFFLRGFRYNEKVIEERRGVSILKFFKELSDFTEKYITETTVNQDLNTLLAPAEFQKVRKILKRETLMFLKDEINRLTKKSKTKFYV